MGDRTALKPWSAALAGWLLLLPVASEADPVSTSIPLVDDVVRNQELGDAPPSSPTAPRRVAPGQFGQAPTQIPSPFLKNRAIAPRSPDLEMPLGDRTTVGVFQDIGRIDQRAATPGRTDRDLGAGLTLQHRFGGP